jgi:hypothetical protein
MYLATRFGRILFFSALLFLVATAAAATGTIQINVHPGSGTVCLDTVCKANQGTINETSTTIFENVEAGRYYMLNIYGTSGYEPYLTQIRLDASGKSLARDISLKPLPSSAPETASLRVFITPGGGQVCMDGRQCEVSAETATESWSVQYTDVTANTYHMLTITKDGYQTSSTQVRLITGQIKTMDIALQPLPAGTQSITQPITPLPATSPVQPTRASLSGFITLFAMGICCSVLFMGKTRQQ